MRTPEEFAKEVSPTKDGMRHQLELMRLDKHVYEWMIRYAIEYHESEALKLNKDDVGISVCDEVGAWCVGCDEKINCKSYKYKLEHPSR